MSYDLDLLDISVDSWEVVDRLAELTSGPEYLSMRAGRRRRFFQGLPPAIHMDWHEGQEVLDDDASWDEDEFRLSPRREALARTVLLLASELGTGWALQSSWNGDGAASEARVTAAQLADLVRRSALNRYVVYRVVDG